MGSGELRTCRPPPSCPASKSATLKMSEINVNLSSNFSIFVVSLFLFESITKMFAIYLLIFLKLETLKLFKKLDNVKKKKLDNVYHGFNTQLFKSTQVQ